MLLPSLQPCKTTPIGAAAPPAAAAALWGARGVEGALAQGAQKLQVLLLGNHKSCVDVALGTLLLVALLQVGPESSAGLCHPVSL